jgi:hypothetical protein
MLNFASACERLEVFLDSTQELDAMRQVAASLDPLKEDARARIIAWAAAKYAVRVYAAPSVASAARSAESALPTGGQPDTVLDDFGSLAEFFDAADPGVESEKALVAGLWMQKRSGMETFDSAAVNRELKHLGHGVGNITAAFNDLMAQKPALAMQTAKSGKSKQARKKYKITRAGEKAVAEMLVGNSDDA